MPDTSGGAKFAFTKLVVRDLDKAAAFYRSVCGYDEGYRVQDALFGRPIEEVIFRRPEGRTELVLLAYLQGPLTSAGDAMTAFDTPDLDAFQSRVLAAGGTVAEPIRVVEFGSTRMRIGFFRDVDGYLLEVIER